MIHEISELGPIPEGLSIERVSRGRDEQEIDYLALHCRIGDERVRLRAMRYGAGRSLEWDVMTFHGEFPRTAPASGVVKALPLNYFTDDPSPAWETAP